MLSIGDTKDDDTVKGGVFDADDEDFDNLPNDDDENQSDSSFMDNVDVMAKYEDLNQDMKLDDIAFIGDVKMLGKQAKEQLRKRNYEYDDEKIKAEAKQEKPQNAFFQAQRA